MPFAAPVFVFDIETIPDVAGLRQLNNLPSDITDSEVVDIAARRLRQERNSDFFPLHLHRIAVISCVLRRYDSQLSAAEQLKIFSLPGEGKDLADEAEAINLFYRGLDKYQPTLVSWNGSGFDLPVLHYRAMIHRQQAPTYWKTDGDFKWNNYLSRYHERHTDLMDLLSLYQGRGYASLNDMSVLCGLPGKIGIGGDKVWETWQRGEISAIRQYCENDALLTYLLYVRYLHFRGRQDVAEEYDFIRRRLQQEPERWGEFLENWNDR